MTEDQEFQKHAEYAIQKLYRALADASDDFNFEVDLNHGALTIEFEHPPAKFVVSPNAPARQVWVSANVKSFKLDWDDVQGAFVLGENGPTLHDLIEQQVAQRLGQDFEL